MNSVCGMHRQVAELLKILYTDQLSRGENRISGILRVTRMRTQDRRDPSTSENGGEGRCVTQLFFTQSAVYCVNFASLEAYRAQILNFLTFFDGNCDL